MPNWEPEVSVAVGARSFRVTVEVQRSPDGDLLAERTWIVSSKHPKERAALVLPPVHRELPIPFGGFYISPAEGVIIAQRKVGSGIDALFVYQRERALHYRLADRTSINDRLLQRFGHPKEQTGTGRKRGPKWSGLSDGRRMAGTSSWPAAMETEIRRSGAL